MAFRVNSQASKCLQTEPGGREPQGSPRTWAACPNSHRQLGPQAPGGR